MASSLDPQSATSLSPFHPVLPKKQNDSLQWGQLHGSSLGLAVASAAQKHSGLVLVLTTDMQAATRLAHELHFFAGDSEETAILTFPDWETLPYDIFSPHQDIISQRLSTLYRLPSVKRGVLIVPISTAMHRLPPRSFLDASTLLLDEGEKFDMDQMRLRLEEAGYQCVSQVTEHGDFSVRGSILDLYPMGAKLPYRIDLFDDEIDSIRTFDPEDQRSIERVKQVRLLPAREFPLHKEGITRFRLAYREAFEGNTSNSPIYRDVNKGLAPSGIEYYLPLFFDQTNTLFDYLPSDTLLLTDKKIDSAAETFWQETSKRYDQNKYDPEHPLLPPAEIFLRVEELFGQLREYPRIRFQQEALPDGGHTINYVTRPLPSLTVDARAEKPLAALTQFLDDFDGRALIIAESPGRRETLLELFTKHQQHPNVFDNWQSFLESDVPLGITVAILDDGLCNATPAIAIITEQQLFGEQVMQRRRRKSKGRDNDTIIRNLTELTIGAPVVHEEHGVGRYLGLQILDMGDMEREFLMLEYAKGDKLYVPVSSLHFINRYTGAENAPLHKLGSDQWEKARTRAAKKVSDVAVELLDIYARRAARQGHRYQFDKEQYAAFAAAFPFEETPDQASTILAIIDDMTSQKPMDRLVCGDVGFGKTEVAMRAAFIAALDGKQVAILAPTTLLAQQHYENFKDRFADWPIQVEVLSRFRSKKQQDETIAAIAAGQVDIIIGTHKILQKSLEFNNLGLAIIDEEHRFGVRQKERFKSMRSEIDLLTLTATPIPRTLNMAMADLRDLSIIATPPAKRVAIKTFITEWNDNLLTEAILRELKRGGQVYVLHNEVQTIERMVSRISELLPEADVRFAHGQMRERELEQVMLDFYHQRFNVLVSSTIIESGIDIPTANTIIINRADKLGLAQLYQIRGRVGRSHHRAYAYLVTPPKKSMSKDAIKRLEAIGSLEELGAGFTLATHDLEIRGTGELLGDEQSGQINEVGFTLYMELLERAVNALKSGKQPELERSLEHGTEIDLQVSALLPADYLPDVHSRLVLYKRIANAANTDELNELQIEMIDRFGLLPDAAKNLLKVTELKLMAEPMNIKKIDGTGEGFRIIFGAEPNMDQMAILKLIQTQPQTYKLDGAEKLRIIKKMPEASDRFQAVEELLKKITLH